MTWHEVDLQVLQPVAILVVLYIVGQQAQQAVVILATPTKVLHKVVLPIAMREVLMVKSIRKQKQMARVVHQ